MDGLADSEHTGKTLLLNNSNTALIVVAAELV